MEAYKTERTIEDDRTLTLAELPFPVGERVEVIVLPVGRRELKDGYPLRGTPYRYDQPTEPVAEDTWEASG
jgi:hypothetical protein